MSKEKTPSTPGKRKQKQDSALSGDAQPAAGGELHQIAGEKHANGTGKNPYEHWHNSSL